MSIHSKTTKSIAKVAGALLLVLLLAIGGCAFFLSSLFSGLCGNELFQEVYSPDHAYKAVVFQRDCGATTGFSTQVSILNAASPLPDEAGNVFVMDVHPDWTAVHIAWETERLVAISYADNYRILEKNETIRILFTQIEVAYRPTAQ